jgi:membrane protease YdiL (CAAX protease family)
MINSQDYLVRPDVKGAEQQVVLSISLIILLALSFAFRYVGHTYFADEFLEIFSPGFALLLANALLSLGILVVCRKYLKWTWDELGLARPNTWWKPLLGTVVLFLVVLGFAEIIHPYLSQFGAEPDLSHLDAIQGNLPLLIFALILVWITAALLQEIVYRAFLINALDILLGRNEFSPWLAVIISAVIFGLMHAWQGLGGILSTACLGLIFGLFYLINGRRLWPIIIIHGLLDTITFISIYNS